MGGVGNERREVDINEKVVMKGLKKIKSGKSVRLHENAIKFFFF